MEVYEAIESRRSIRKYKADPIDSKTLNMILEAGRLAPSWEIPSAGDLLLYAIPVLSPNWLEHFLRVTRHVKPSKMPRWL